jgi:NAD(P)H dehydrogenase (quinone)
LGAAAAIGSIADVDFLTNTFKGADAVYAMIPLSFTEPDLGAYMHRMAQNYAEALKEAKYQTDCGHERLGSRPG